MADELHWIPVDAKGRLATMARPLGGDWLDGDLLRLQAQGVTGIVSMLEQAEEVELQLSHEASSCLGQGLSFRSHPVPDRGVPPDGSAFWSFARSIHEDILDGAVIAVHCRAGIGRSSLAAAAVLTLLGHTPAEAFAAISDARGLPVPDTDDQRAWFECSASAEGVCSG